MNLSLLDPFSLAQDYPETLSKRLSEYASRWTRDARVTCPQTPTARHLPSPH